MSNNIEDKNVEKRLKEVYECTRHPGWNHIADIFLTKIAELKNIESIASYPDDEKLKMITIHVEVAQRLNEILTQVTNEVDLHLSQTTEQVTVYGDGDFGE